MLQRHEWHFALDTATHAPSSLRGIMMHMVFLCEIVSELSFEAWIIHSTENLSNKCIVYHAHRNFFKVIASVWNVLQVQQFTSSKPSSQLCKCIYKGFFYNQWNWISLFDPLSNKQSGIFTKEIDWQTFHVKLRQFPGNVGLFWAWRLPLLG